MNACPNGTAPHIPGWSGGAQNWTFWFKFESIFDRNDTMMTIRESHTLSEALLFLLIYLREVGKCSSSNRCMSLRYSVIFPRLIWCPKLAILLIKKCLFDRNYAVMTIGRSNMLTWALPIILIYLMKVGKYPSSNGFMSLIRHIITFPKLFVILLKFWGFIW